MLICCCASLALHGQVHAALLAAVRVIVACTLGTDGLDVVDLCLDRIVGLVAQNASPAQMEVFAPDGAHRPPLPVQLCKRALNYQGAVELKTAFTAAFNAIARTDDGSLRAVFDTHVVRSKVPPRLAEQ